MENIQLLEKEHLSQEVQEALDEITNGSRVINIFKVMSNSLTALKTFLGIIGALKKSTITADVSERIALRLAIINGCEYCLAAHSYSASKILSQEEILNAREGKSNDAKAQAALIFAESVMKHIGNVSDEVTENVKSAGFTSSEILDIVSIVTLNFFTNAVNNVSHTKVDFPKPKE